MIFSFGGLVHAQGLTPSQQERVDSLIRWIQNEQLSGRQANQAKLDSANRTLREQFAKENEAAKSNPVTVAGAYNITRSVSAGGSAVVPKGKKWNVTEMFVNDGGKYNVKVTSVKFESFLVEGEKLSAPSWCAEGELLGKEQSSFFYVFRINETDIKR
jgi:hypothetical protein